VFDWLRPTFFPDSFAGDRQGFRTALSDLLFEREVALKSVPDGYRVPLIFLA